MAEGAAKILSPNMTTDQKISALDKGLADLWDRIDSLSRKNLELQGLLANSGKMSLEQIFQLIRTLKQVAHRGIMPDIDGTNPDHDRRYVKKSEVSQYLGDYARYFDDLEMIMEYALGELTRYVEYSYTGTGDGKDLILVTIYEDSTKAVTLFTKAFTYNGDGDITQKVLTRIRDGKILTTDLTYDADEDLNTKTNTPST